MENRSFSKKQFAAGFMIVALLAVSTDALAAPLHRKAYRHARHVHKHRFHKVLPIGYKTVLVNGVKHFVHRGVYYRHNTSGYYVVTAPVQTS